MVISREVSVFFLMVFGEGKRKIGVYETPFGSATIGIDTHKITNTLNEQGGELNIDYSLHFDRMMVSRNQFLVKIKEQAVS